MRILAIETSCDDTCVAVLENDRILSNVISSQVDLYKKWGGVVPDIAKRAHRDRIWPVLGQALKLAISCKSQAPNLKLQTNSNLPSFAKGYGGQANEKIRKIIDERMEKIDVVAVTQGPGLAIALGVGIEVAKELAKKYGKKIVAVNHVEGHILSNFLKNSRGKPERKIKFPSLVLTVSGGHTKLVLMKGIGKYEIIGETLDDAAGEALDKAAKMLGLGYPGGPIIEKLAEDGDENFLDLPRPMSKFKNCNFSFSGLKTSFYYKIRKWKEERVAEKIYDLASSYQRAVFDCLLIKLQRAIDMTKPKSLMGAGGVMANLRLRKDLRKLARKNDLQIFMPFKKELNTDNAAMVGIAGYCKAKKGEFVKNIDKLEREARLELVLDKV
ncbi:tRNA (adenosine(37)-N6)-threonylcarbamoyltransferase complex transferase subunit TsaD [Patescibacteria group bacterium]|nr:tRNA (adenosine(37)-N6)-threonylcarbamoyltransferase complex transferase subunit TsaD [Patescibacteria group bacterium]MCG2702604.1 tRNA (adenosine(37)-N6)-threonylcarbamoyltransferase complex transferase subunit TsaD [Candidatus Parcubacteria bacterium]MBU4265502.1 tRNA (adenosine(37)-N6)-threonylcarbamoyltransferase complex transferase subunit TsaD [Patescibacteria group bacterium]MBU4390552.1 tRNA (adenosine(37)-N6)-threonylcarbamoyltransferase complex transferase subunit TsaD [Patescibact